MIYLILILICHLPKPQLSPANQNLIAVDIAAISIFKGNHITSEMLDSMLVGTKSKIYENGVIEIILKDGRKILSAAGDKGLDKIKSIVKPDIVLTEQIEEYTITHAGVKAKRDLFKYGLGK